jgi:type VI secretion system secreted protein Hcp
MSRARFTRRKGGTLKKAIVPALALAAALAAPALGAPIYMKFDGIDGEAMNAPTPGSIEIQTTSLDAVERQAAQKAPRGGSAIPISLPTFTFVHTVDKASPALMKAAAKGTHFKKVTLFVRKTGGGNDYLVVTMKDVFISSVSPSGGGAASPMETITIGAAQSEAAYHPPQPAAVPGAVQAAPRAN